MRIISTVIASLFAIAIAIAGCSGAEKPAPAAAEPAPVMTADEMATYHCSGATEKIQPLHDACQAEKTAGKTTSGPNCRALVMGNAKVAEINQKTPGACSPKIRF